jgi:hypothetical protein
LSLANWLAFASALAPSLQNGSCTEKVTRTRC